MRNSWFVLQGVLVQGADKGSFFLQDGTGSIPLQMGAESWKPGMHRYDMFADI